MKVGEANIIDRLRITIFTIAAKEEKNEMKYPVGWLEEREADRPKGCQSK